jgi:hypothetical protein
MNKKYYGGGIEDWIRYYIGPENHTIIMRIGTIGSGKTSSVNLFIDNVLHL